MSPGTGRWIALLLVAGLLQVPLAGAGSFAEPEIRDGRGDANLTGQGSGADAVADVRRAWIEASDGELAFTVSVDSGENLGTVATLANVSYHVVFDAGGSRWRTEVRWTGQPPAPQAAVFRNTTRMDDAEASASVDGANVTATWSNPDDVLPADALLKRTFAFTQAQNSNDVVCNGHDVVDCGPDDGTYGAVFARGGTPALEVSTPGATAFGEPGDPVTFDVVVRNTGTRDARATLSTDAPSGWSPTFGASSLDVAAGGENGTTLTLTVPDGRRDDLNLTVTAETPGSSASLSLTVDVERGGRARSVSLSITRTRRTVAPGGTASYSIAVSNVGRLDDTYEATVSGADRRWVQLSPDSLTVTSGQTRRVTVDVVVPEDASPGPRPHSVRVASQGNATVSEEVTVTTTVAEADGGLGVLGDPVTLLGAVSLLALVVLVVLVLWLRRGGPGPVAIEEVDDDPYR